MAGTEDYASAGILAPGHGDTRRIGGTSVETYLYGRASVAEVVWNLVAACDFLVAEDLVSILALFGAARATIAYEAVAGKRLAGTCWGCGRSG